MIISLINIYAKDQTDERQFDLSVAYGVCPQNRKQSYKLKILYNFKQAMAQSENDIKIRLLLVCHL